MSKFEEEDVVKMPLFLKQDLSTIQVKSEKLNARIQLQLKFVDRFNQILSDSKQRLHQLTQKSKACLESQKKAYLKFDRQNFEEIKKTSPKVWLMFLDFLQIPFAEFLPFEEISNKMQVFQVNGQSEKFKKISMLIERYEPGQKPEKPVLCWAKNVILHEEIKKNIQDEKQKIKEINSEIQTTMLDIKKMASAKEKFESNQKDIVKYLEHENVSSHSTEYTMLSKKSNQSCRIKSSFELLKINESDLGYREIKASQEEDFIKFEDGSELGCCSFKFLCF